MGLGGIVKSGVETTYRANTKQHRDAIKKLSGEQRKMARDQLDSLEKQNKKIDSNIAMWGKVAVGLGAVIVAYKGLQGAMSSFQENSRVALNESSLSIEGLRQATRGLVGDTELLTIAKKLNSGTFKIGQAQIEKTLQGALALRKEMGIPLKEAIEKVTQAVNEANLEALKPFGKKLEGVNETASAQRLIIDDLDKSYRNLGGNVEIEGDKMIKAQTGLANAIDDGATAMGRLATELAPVVELLADAAGFIADAVTWISGDKGSENYKLLQSKQQDIYGVLTGKRGMGIASLPDNTPSLSLGSRGSAMESALLDKKGAFKKGTKKLNVGMVMDGETIYTVPVLDLMFAESQLTDSPQTAQQFAQFLMSGKNNSKGNVEFSGSSFSEQQKRDEQAQKALADAPIDAAELELKNMALASSYDLVREASGAAFEALVNGSDLSMKAIQKMTAGMLMALGKQAAAQALWELAQGTAKAITGNPQAAGHFAAAGMYAATATAAGLGAHALGKAGGGSATGGTPTAAQPAFGGGSSGNSTQIVVLGEGWDDMNPRERSASARRMMRRGGISLEGDSITPG